MYHKDNIKHNNTKVRKIRQRELSHKQISTDMLTVLLYLDELFGESLCSSGLTV